MWEGRRRGRGREGEMGMKMKMKMRGEEITFGTDTDKRENPGRETAYSGVEGSPAKPARNNQCSWIRRLTV